MKVAEALGIRSRNVIAIVGGGGKTTLMFRLASELASAGWRVVTTTSTRLAAHETTVPPQCLVRADPDGLLADLPRALLRDRHVLVVSALVPQLDMAGGLPLAVIEQIARLPEVDILIVEADGARALPFKAPAAHEPVIPACATIVIPVAGLDVLGQPLTAEHAHRPELIANLGHVTLGAPITTAVVAAVIGHREGGAKAAPPTARIAPFLNKADLPGTHGAADAIAQALLKRPWIERVVAGAVKKPEPVWAFWQCFEIPGRCVPGAGSAATRYGRVSHYEATMV